MHPKWTLWKSAESPLEVPLRAEWTVALDSSQHLQTSPKHAHKVCKSAWAVKSRHLDSAIHFLNQMFMVLSGGINQIADKCHLAQCVTHWWVVLLSEENTCWIHTGLPSYNPAPLVPHWCMSHCVPVCRVENVHWQKPCEDRYRQRKVKNKTTYTVVYLIICFLVTFNYIISHKPKFARG